MQPLVSVIVPVYKVEDVLVRCLDSLCRQSLTDIEMILIDDASPDRCGEICDAYAAGDARFRVFHHTKNLGLSEARNTGIANATSDYLMFVDSDDWVHKDFCKDAYECAVKYQADLVMFQEQYIKSQKVFNLIHCLTNSSYKAVSKPKYEAMDLLLRPSGLHAMTKLYRKELFKNISFPPGCLYEDVGTTYKTIWQASRIYYLDKVLYYHNYRAGSIITLKTEQSLNDMIKMFMQQYHDLAAWGYPKDKLEVLLKNIALTYCIRKKPDASDKYYPFYANVLLSSKSIPSNFTRKRKILYVLFKHCRPLFEIICDLFDKKYY